VAHDAGERTVTDRWTIRVADDFTRTPGARFRKDGAFSGEELLEDLVAPRLREAIAAGARLTLDFDGMAGMPESFLSELFFGLARMFGSDELERYLRVVSTDDPHIVLAAAEYMGLNKRRAPELDRLHDASAAALAAIATFNLSAAAPLSEHHCRHILEALRTTSNAVASLCNEPAISSSRYRSAQASDAQRAVAQMRRALTSADRFPSDDVAPSADETARGVAAYDALASILDGLVHTIERGIVEPEVVFISYAHDSEDHCDNVLGLAERLRAEGLNCKIDRFTPAPSEGWPLWMERGIRDATFVLVVGSPAYICRYDLGERPGVGLGAIWEAVLMREDLYEGGGLNEKFIPVLFAGDELSSLPKPLRPHTRYRLPADYDDLYRHLTNQPSTVARSLGPRRVFDL
jgi:hypothetical protein